VIASTSVSRLADLRGRKVNCQQPLSAASILCETLFEALSLPAEILHFEAEEALVKLRKGELDAVVRVGGAPIPGLAGIKSGEGLHLVPVGSANLSGKEFDKIRVLYAPALLKHETYPQLISEGEVVPTLASGAALAVCGWPEDTKRYAVLAKFVQVFFDNIDKFHGAPRHPKWRDVNLAAEIPGWKRFKPAREWLDARRPREPARVASARNTVALKAAFDKFVQDYLASRNMEALSYEERKVLLAQFMAWSEAQPGANER
jgi:hypothetical protein